jgi:phosphatidylglycerol:prolipoprotein diacylglycerol transferase
MQPLFLFKFLGVPFFSYTTLVVTGIVLAWLTVVSQMRAQSKHILELRAINAAFASVALGAVVVGRSMHIIYNAAYFSERPAEWARYLDGGLSFIGVCIGGGMGLWWWCRRRRVRLAWAMDTAALPVAVVASLAWLGAFLHGSQYGAPVDNPLALELRDTLGVVVARWPTQLCAAVWCALWGLGLLWWGRVEAPSAHQRVGWRATWFIVAYSIGLFVLDFTRGDASLMLLGLRLTQWLYVVVSGWALWQQVATRGRSSER